MLITATETATNRLFQSIDNVTSIYNKMVIDEKKSALFTSHVRFLECDFEDFLASFHSVSNDPLYAKVDYKNYVRFCQSIRDTVNCLNLFDTDAVSFASFFIKCIYDLRRWTDVFKDELKTGRP